MSNLIMVITINNTKGDVVQSKNLDRSQEPCNFISIAEEFALRTEPSLIEI